MIEFSREHRPAEPAAPTVEPDVPAVRAEAVAPLPLRQAITAASGATLQRKMQVGASADPLEREADAVADCVVGTLGSTGAMGAQRTIRRAQPVDSIQRVTDASDWIEDENEFVTATTKFRRLKKRSAEVAAIETHIGQLGTYPKTNFDRLSPLDAIVKDVVAWQAKASENNPRRDPIQQLGDEARAQIEFLGRARVIATAISGAADVAAVGAEVAKLALLRDERLGAPERYGALLDTLAQSGADRLAALEGERVSDEAVDAAVVVARNTLPDAPTVQQVFATYCAHLRTSNIEYTTAGKGKDVFTGTTTADCSSVAGGFVRYASKFGIVAARVDCGSSKFLTAAVDPATSMPGEANVIDATPLGSFPGRRYIFSGHFVAEVEGAKYCGVIGKTWTDGCVEIAGSTKPASFEPIPSDRLPDDPLLEKVYPGTNFGIATSAGVSYLVGVRAKAGDGD